MNYPTFITAKQNTLAVFLSQNSGNFRLVSDHMTSQIIHTASTQNAIDHYIFKAQKIESV